MALAQGEPSVRSYPLGRANAGGNRSFRPGAPAQISPFSCAHSVSATRLSTPVFW
jgi:hypothetical protein